MPLRDVLTPRPRVLFVGINPSLHSEAAGHHFAGPSNPFWRLLYETGLVPEPLTHADDQRLAEWGLALTNLCPRATRTASELYPDELRAGRRALVRKIQQLRPEVVALVGVTLYRLFFPRSVGGAGLRPETIDGARVFVLPNPSGLNASFPRFGDKRIWFDRLNGHLKRRRRLPTCRSDRRGRCRRASSSPA